MNTSKPTQTGGEATPEPLTYHAAGVNIEAGSELVERIKPLVRATTQGHPVLNQLGGFAACYDLTNSPYQEPVLVAATDGVGTKLRLALELNQHDTVGIDLVAMCANDILACGAKPLFFLDYYACSRLNIDLAEQVISGIAKGCQEAGFALVGGETAEMPGHYQNKDYDLAGFAVGIIDKKNIIKGDHVQPGDRLIGLASSGAHSNGYSLIRKIITDKRIDLNTEISGAKLAQLLLCPTRIYVKSVLKLLHSHPVHAIAHITGGGILENLPRVLPVGCDAYILTSSWPMPELFAWLQNQAQLTVSELYRTFNCGIGLILCVPQDSAASAIELLHKHGESAFLIGEIRSNNNLKPTVHIQ